MRFFRIPAFTGIETHRDDADRGSLRVVEGCVPHGPGGLRSGPVWEKVGDVDLFSDSNNSQSHMTGADDGKGNSIVYVSRAGDIHDMAVFSTENTDIESLGSTYAIASPTLYNQKAVITPIGNRLYAMGDGSAEAAYIGKGPPTATASIFPDEVLYDQEWSRFPNCNFYVQGPKKTIFAAGNPDKPLTIYISEPAGLTSPYRDNPYSTEETKHYPGALSTVEILSSNASKITALSTRGDQVVVHTDKGCHLLYAPQSDQASTGYRTEQTPATNFSGAVNVQVVAGESGTQPFWLGHDGQIYKDEAATRGAEDYKSYTDPRQASWKAKGQWEKELPVDLSGSFATYDPLSGMYWVYVESDEYKDFIKDSPPNAPFLLNAEAESVQVPINLNAEAETVQAPVNLNAEAETVQAPINLNAEAPPQPPINLNAEAEAVLSPINLNANAETVLAPINLNAGAETVLAPINLNAEAEAVLAPINLNAEAETVQAPINLNAEAEALSPPINLHGEKTCCAAESDWETLIKFELFTKDRVFNTAMLTTRNGTNYWANKRGEFHFTPVDNGNGCFNTATATKNDDIPNTSGGYGWADWGPGAANGWWSFEDPEPTCNLDADCNPLYDFTTYVTNHITKDASGELVTLDYVFRWGPDLEYTPQAPVNLNAEAETVQAPINLNAEAETVLAPINLHGEKTCCVAQNDWVTSIIFEQYLDDGANGSDIKWHVPDGRTFTLAVRTTLTITPIDNGSGCFNTASTSVVNDHYTSSGVTQGQPISTPPDLCTLDADCNPLYNFDKISSAHLGSTNTNTSGELINSVNPNGGALAWRWAPNLEFLPQAPQAPINLNAEAETVQAPINLHAEPELFSAYRNDTNSSPGSIWFLMSAYANNNLETGSAMYFKDGLTAAGAASGIPTSQSELDGPPWSNFLNSNKLDAPIQAFWPTVSGASDFIGPVKYEEVSGVKDRYLYWVKMSWGGLRDWSDFGLHGLANQTYQWAQTINGTFPSWYVKCKTSSSNNTGTRYFWLIADSDGQYRIRAHQGKDIGINYATGSIPGQGQLGIVATPTPMTGSSSSFSSDNAFRRHSLSLHGFAYNVWITPTPVTNLTNLSDQFAYVNSSGSTITNTFRVRDTS